MKLYEPDGQQVEVDPEIHRAVKALGSDPAHAVAVQFIIYQLCGRHRSSFLVGVPNPTESMVWLEGRRYVGEMIARLIERPVEEKPVVQPPARSMTEKVRRRQAGKPAF